MTNLIILILSLVLAVKVVENSFMKEELIKKDLRIGIIEKQLQKYKEGEN